MTRGAQIPPLSGGSATPPPQSLKRPLSASSSPAKKKNKTTASATKEPGDASPKHSEKKTDNLALLSTMSNPLAVLQAGYAANKEKALRNNALAEKDQALKAAALAQQEKDQALKAAALATQASMFTIQLPALDRLGEQLTQSSSQILRRISDSTSEAVAAALSNVQPATVDLVPLREDVRTLLKAHDERFNSLKSDFDAQASLIRALASDVWSLKDAAAAATTSFTTADRDLLKARGDTITSLYSSFTALNCMLTRFLSGPGTDQVVEESTTVDDFQVGRYFAVHDFDLNEDPTSTP